MGKLFDFPLRLAVKRDGEWDLTSKSGVFAVISPTGNMTADFSHSLGRKLPLGSHGWISSPERQGTAICGRSPIVGERLPILKAVIQRLFAIGRHRPFPVVHGRCRECRLSDPEPVVQLLPPEGHACVTIDRDGPREMLVGILPPPFAPIEPPEAGVAVGDEWAHVERLG